MKNVTYINAGAGSGKTFTLTERLSQTLGDKKALPSEIILTTFTNQAANDFKAKSKAKLFEKGLFEEANLLDTAVIGTIHSVAYSIISKFWYYLELSPKLDILTEEESKVYQSESLGSLATQQELDKLSHIAQQFDQRSDWKGAVDPMFWKSHIASIIGFATNYQISDFSKSCEKSKEFFRRFVVPGLPALPTIESLAVAFNAFESINNAAKESKDKVNRAQAIREIKQNINHLGYADYAKFQRLCTNKMFSADPRISPVLASIVTMWQTEEVYKLVSEYIDIMFDMASRWQKQYAEFKKARNLLDFNDLEKYLLQLLENETAATEIAGQFKYLFVDEYQDCSPIQVKIFQKLSAIVEHSYWVGDMKQSIYGFRGSDPKLVESIIQDIEASTSQGCNIQTLSTSWRSVPEIVELCNDVFVTAFSNMPEERVRLKAKKDSCVKIPPLMLWPLDGSNADARNEEIADYVSQMIYDGVAPADIAILARTNSNLKTIADLLSQIGVPVDLSSEPIKDSKVTRLACAALRLADNNADSLAKAEIAFLTDSTYYTDNLISETLEHINPESARPCHDFLNKVSLVNKIINLRSNLKHQSLSEFVESVILELDMYEEGKKCDEEKYVERILNTIIIAAQQYQESAKRLDSVASVPGFIDYLETQDICIPGDSTGVHLVSMHKAKGLEWKHVIVTPLSAHPADVDTILRRECFEVHFRRDAEIDKSDVFGNVYIALTPYIYGVNTKIPGVIGDIIKNTEEFKQIQTDHISEEARVLYVAMTRPTEQLILTMSGKNPFQWLEDIGVDSKAVIASHNFANPQLLEPADEDLEENIPMEDEDNENYSFLYSNPEVHEYRDHHPSGIKETVNIVGHYDFQKRIPLNLPKSLDMSIVGDCIHHIYQLCAEEYPSDYTVEKVLSDYGLKEYLTDREEIRNAWHRLVDYVHSKHGSIFSHRHERSFVHHKEGKVYTGSIDLTFDTPQGTVLVDFKTCPMGNTAILNPEAEHYAGHYGGQLLCYHDALRAAGNNVCATYVYYPVSGILVQLA